MEDRSMFALRLIELRKANRMTQEYVAKHLGLNRTSYTCYEIGTSMPTIATLCALADLFEVSVDYMLGRSNHKALIDSETDYPSIEEVQLTAAYRRLNDRQRRALRELIKSF